MAKYLFVYHGGGMPETEEAQAAAMQAWGDWLAGMGEQVVDGGNPVGMSLTVASDGSVARDGGANPASGYSIIEAKDDADAAEKAKGCPILDHGGSVEVAPIIELG